MMKFIKSRGFMGGVMSLIGLLSVFGIQLDPEVVQALLDNVVAMVTLVGVILAQLTSIWGRIKADGPLVGDGS